MLRSAPWPARLFINYNKIKGRCSVQGCGTTFAASEFPANEVHAGRNKGPLVILSLDRE